MKLEQFRRVILLVHSTKRFPDSLICDSGVLKCCLWLVWWMISQRCLFFGGVSEKVTEPTSWKAAVRELCGLLALGFTCCSGTHFEALEWVVEIHLKSEADKNIWHLILHICSLIKNWLLPSYPFRKSFSISTHWAISHFKATVFYIVMIMVTFLN